MDEVQVMDGVSPGDKVVGPLLRLSTVRAFGIVDHATCGHAIAVTLVPDAGDVDFPEPITFLIPLGNLEFFVKLIRTAQALVPKSRGGSA
jgi:hypothetical protein